MSIISTATLISILNLKDDYELRGYAKKEISDRYSFLVLDIIEAAINAETDQECSKCLRALNEAQEMSVDATAILSKEVLAARNQEFLPMECIMELYHSDNEFLIDKSKEKTILQYDQFVYSVIHQYCPSYASKYKEELYQSGVIGILEALKNYDVDKGAFTTYSKMFIMHQLSEQINFSNNGTSTYYNQVQNKIKAAEMKLKADKMDISVSALAILTELNPEVIKRELAYMERTKFLYLDAEDETTQIFDLIESPEDLSIKKESTSILLEVLESLPDKTKDVVIRKFIMGETDLDIANRYQTSTGKIKAVFQKGLKMLKADPRIRHAFSDRLTNMENEMLKFSMYIEDSHQSFEERVDDTICAVNTLFDDDNDEDDSILDINRGSFDLSFLSEDEIMHTLNKKERTVNLWNLA